MIKIGIIGGTGLCKLGILDEVKFEEINTEYGNIRINVGKYKHIPVAFLARHGQGHKVPPHKVNYRGNILALKKLGVQRILATGAVGSLNEAIQPGSFVLLDQFIDFTKNRPQTFFKEDGQGVIHLDMTEPYCPEMKRVIADAANSISLPIKLGGVYVCTEGPRFETAAEIKMFSKLGGDVVGMTGCPEVFLAREAELCYSAISLVTNYSTGISKGRLTHAEVDERMTDNYSKIRDLFMRVIETIPELRSCECSHSLAEIGSLGGGGL